MKEMKNTVSGMSSRSEEPETQRTAAIPGHVDLSCRSPQLPEAKSDVQVRVGGKILWLKKTLKRVGKSTAYTHSEPPIPSQN